MSKKLRTRTLVKALLACCGAALLAACSSSGPSGSGAATSDGASSTGQRATGAPVVIGYVDSSNGAFKYPHLSEGAKAAVSWINNHGGLGGHAVDLKTCLDDGSPSGGIACANQLVSKHVLAVVSPQDSSIDSQMPIYKKAGIPVLGYFCTPGMSAASSTGAFDFCGPSLTTATAAFYAYIGTKNVVFVVPDLGPALATYAKSIQSIYGPYGITTSLSVISSANPDVTAAVTAARAKHADTLLFALTENGCDSAIRTAKSLGWSGKIAIAVCSNFITDLGPSLASGVYLNTNEYPYQAAKSASELDSTLAPEFVEYKAALEADKVPNRDLDSYSTVQGFATYMTVFDALKLSTDLTSASITATFNAYSGRAFMGLQTDCVHRVGSACGTSMIGLQVQSDGSLKVIGKPFAARVTTGK